MKNYIGAKNIYMIRQEFLNYPTKNLACFYGSQFMIAVEVTFVLIFLLDAISCFGCAIEMAER